MILYVLLKWDDYSNYLSEHSQKAAVPTQRGVWVHICSSAPAQALTGKRELDGCTSQVQPSTELALTLRSIGFIVCQSSPRLSQSCSVAQGPSVLSACLSPGRARAAGRSSRLPQVIQVFDLFLVDVRAMEHNWETDRHCPNIVKCCNK